MNEVGFAVVVWKHFLSSSLLQARYEGEFHQGKKQGYGILTFVNGDQYKGEWKVCLVSVFKLNRYGVVLIALPICVPQAGYKYGKGTYVWSNGSKYKGFYVSGKKEGRGMMKYNNGDK